MGAPFGADVSPILGDFPLPNGSPASKIISQRNQDMHESWSLGK